MTCDCRKHAPDPDCDRPGHSASERTFPSQAFYEERIRLLEEKLRFVQQQNGALRIEIARLGGTE